MRNERLTCVLACTMAVLLGVPGATAGTNPPGTAITYQGELTQNPVPGDSVCDFLITLYDGDCDDGGQPIGAPVLAPGSQRGPDNLRSSDILLAGGEDRIAANSERT